MAALWRPNHANKKANAEGRAMRPRETHGALMIGGVVCILMSTSPSTSYRVEAYNLSHASENKIHDDTVAQKLGFERTGELPGGMEGAYGVHFPAYTHKLERASWDAGPPSSEAANVPS